MKTRRRNQHNQRGGLYHEPNMVRLLKQYGNLHKSKEIKFYEDYTFFDNYGCMQLYFNNKWWEELFREAVPAAAPAMGGAGGAASAMGGAGGPPVAARGQTINMICLSETLLGSFKADKNELVLSRAQPGLNFVLLCNVGKLIDKWNKDAEKGNKKGYYYLGFEPNVHIIDNVIVLREQGIDDFSEGAKRITQDHYDIMLRRILNPNEVIRNRIHKKVAYLTIQNIIDKIRTLFAAITEQKQITPETLSELEKQIQIKRSKIGSMEKGSNEEKAEKTTFAKMVQEHDAKTQLYAKIPKEVCLFGFADATIVPVEYAGPPKSGISEENFKKLELNTRRPTFGNPDFDKYIKNLNNEVEAAAAKAAAKAVENVNRRKSAEAANDEQRKTNLIGSIKKYLDEITFFYDNDADLIKYINEKKTEAEDYMIEQIGKDGDPEDWSKANEYGSYANYLFCKIIELIGVAEPERCPSIPEPEVEYWEGEGGKRKTRRRR